jgi:hypothetical protein
MRRIARLLYWTLTFQLPARLRQRRNVRRTLRRIAESGLCDAAFYYERYPDIRDASLDPVHHYVHHGAAEGRNPHPLFDTSYYVHGNPDVNKTRCNPLEHFIVHGWSEGRNPSPACDLATYLAEHPSLVETGVGSLPELLERAAAELLERRADTQLEPVLPAPDPPPRRGPTLSLRRILEPAAEHPNGNRQSREGRGAAPDDPIVVVVAHVCPCPPRQGNEYRIQRYLRWLESRGHQAIFVCCPLPGEELDDRDLVQAASELSNFIYCDRRGDVALSLAPHLEEIVAGLDGTEALPLSEDEARLCATEVELSPDLAQHEATFCPDVLLRVLLHIDARLPEATAYIANYVLSTLYLPLLRTSRLRILDTHDVFSSKAEKVSAYGVENNLEISHAEERALLLRASVVMAIQPDEARELADLVPDRGVIDVGVDFDTAPEDHAPLPPARAPQRVLMVGSANPMNVKGLGDFLAYVWPLVIREHPDAELLVAGAVSGFVPDESPNVTPLGHVESLEELYRGCRLVVNAAVAGTGLKIKTLESLASWRPLVTWPTGVDGLPRELLTLCVVVTDLYEFYLAIAKALSESPREAYDEDERGLIRYSLSGLRAYRELEEVLGELVSSAQGQVGS